jgi:two-component system sensor histidine kinase YesM
MVAIISVLLISYLVSKSILTPVRRLLEDMQKAVDNNEHDYILTSDGTDEISFISNQFNNLLRRMDQLIHENYIAKIHEKELMILQKDAQLEALQQQINPHFLYNTLESINWMAYQAGAMDICKMVSALGRFLRAALKNNDIITIREEISNLRDYVFIQKLRYSGRLKIKWDINEEVYGYNIVKLVLQPLVENAIKHGLDSLKDGGEITVRADFEKEYILIQIMDNGIGMSESQVRNILNGIDSSVYSKSNFGIRNVFLRLKYVYNNDFSFNIISKAGSGTEVRLRIPAQQC